MMRSRLAALVVAGSLAAIPGIVLLDDPGRAPAGQAASVALTAEQPRPYAELRTTVRTLTPDRVQQARVDADGVPDPERHRVAVTDRVSSAR